LAILLVGCAAQPVAPVAQARVVEQNPAPGGSPGRLATFAGSDQAELAYLAYTTPGARTALVYLHGIESHAGWFALAAGQLREQGLDVYCLDRRGSGLNRENRGFISGYTDSYETLLADIRAFVVPLRKRYDQVFLVGLSWGGKLALSYGLNHADDIDGLILITPGLRAEVDVSVLNKLKIALLSLFHPTARVPTPIQPEMFTTTPVYLDYIRDDPLRLSSATVRFFWNSRRLDNYIDSHMATNRLPMQLFIAGQDTIIDNQGVLRVLQPGQEAGLDVLLYADQTHSIQLDAPERLVHDVVQWIKRQSGAP
jgi:alpha-beta hydrolase superfamily lysophospholipase